MPFSVDLKFIAETELKLGIEFPESFKNKMMIENGGELLHEEENWQLYPFLDKSNDKTIKRTCNHIILETKQAREWNNFPKNGIAIATNGSGDQLVLIPSDINPHKLKNEIYLWLHETGKLTQVANSISELL
jgi:hypothetical protein